MASALSAHATLRKVAKFRTKHRLPALAWRHPSNGAALLRSSQVRHSCRAVSQRGWVGWLSAPVLIRATRMPLAAAATPRDCHESVAPRRRIPRKRACNGGRHDVGEPRVDGRRRCKGTRVVRVWWCGGDGDSDGDGGAVSQADAAEDAAQRLTFHVVDARPKLNASANRFKGGGHESALSYTDHTYVCFCFCPALTPW